MDPVLVALLGPHHFFLRRDALVAGLTDDVLRGWVRSGLVRRVRHGAYTTTAHWASLTPDGRHLLTARCVARSARVRVALSHTTAALIHGAPVWGLPLHDVHVARSDRLTGRREAGVRQHRAALPAADVMELDGLLVTTPVRTCVDVTTIAGVEVSLGVIDHLLHTHAVSKDELLVRAAALSRRPGSLTTELTFRLADGRSESVGETRTRYRCWLGHLPRPVPQYEVTHRGRVLYRLDLAWPEHGVWLEFDGREKYLKHRRDGESVVDCVLREKRREEQIALCTGWRCVRITWVDLYEPERLVARIAAVLAGGAVHP